MRVVVLHSQERDSPLCRQLLRRGGGEVVRVHVAGHGPGLKVEEPCEVAQLLLVAVERLQVLEVAYVLAREGVAVLRKAEARLLLRPAGEQPFSEVLH